MSISSQSDQSSSISSSADLTPGKATSDDFAGINRLIELNRGNLLPRSAEELQELLDTTWVIRAGAHLPSDPTRVIGCVMLEIYSHKICELRTLAVDPQFQKLGLGKKLVEAAVAEARKRKIPQVLTVTSTPEFFERLNFGPCLNEKYALFYRG